MLSVREPWPVAADASQGSQGRHVSCTHDLSEVLRVAINVQLNQLLPS